MEQRTQQEADQRRRQRQMPSTLVDTDVSMPHNLNQHNINWSSFEVQDLRFPASLSSTFRLLHALAGLECGKHP